MFLSTIFSGTCRIKRLMFIAGICVFLMGCKGKDMAQSEEDAGTSSWEDKDKSAGAEDDIKVPNGGMLEARFEIAEIYPGNLYEDTCLTGLIMEFTGRHSH